MIDEEQLVDLYEAGDALAGGDSSAMQRLLPHMKNRESYSDIPVLFYVAENVKTLDFLAENDVDFFKKTAWAVAVCCIARRWKVMIPSSHGYSAGTKPTT
ncbi:hypothetical protein JFT91_13855 [Pseudomonas sp. TH08]|uniref:hypothetical protein n=1 Tax=Pseudomonas sp. TH08 TaxID=2796374 RepID=UPI00191471A7|nr:hypothetical protein [Pseudomonas sp. TH08]MBK5533667.1 hypothetical protein [Pseudomonas sp. TH08]